MESLNETKWDVVISGTGLPQSLLALALSRSGNKVLHVDCNEYYGGEEAALSLSEAEVWTLKHAKQDSNAQASFDHASITTAPQEDRDTANVQLSSPRSYSLALAPQLLYTRSQLLPALVSSQTHSQLEFQAVASWFIISTPTGTSAQKLIRVPGGREDVFKDDTLDLKAKRALMKFIRFVTSYEEQVETWQPDRSKPLSAFLEEKFGLPAASHAPLLALALSNMPRESTTVEYALPRIATHLSSIGLFGPGFPAVLPKWGGLAEIGQVACRASAVGGGVYVLGRGIADVQQHRSDLSVRLSDGEEVTTKWLCGTLADLPRSVSSVKSRSVSPLLFSKSISIVSSPLSTLFPLTSEGGVTPAGAVLLIPGTSEDEPPVHILAHSSDTGECPANQCVLYASVAEDHLQGFNRLDNAVNALLHSIDMESKASVLWRLQYRQQYYSNPSLQESTGNIITLMSLAPAQSVEDAVLEDVKRAWKQITDDDVEAFMKFDAREGTLEDD